MNPWRRKPLSAFDRGESSSSEPSLPRTIGALQLTTLGIGAIIGAGIFVVTGTAAATYAGPAIVLSFGLAGIACLCAALCYAEFASLISVSGSAYSYAYVTLGEAVAWAIGWMLVLEYLVSGAAVAVGWSGYFVAFFGLDERLTSSPLNLPAAALVVVLTACLAIGMRSSTAVNGFMVAVKLTVIALVIIFGSQYVDPENWDPFVPENTGVSGEFGWSGVVRGAAVIFYAYLGFDTVSTAAQEARNPQRDVPIGILASLVVCTVLYVAMALVLTGLVDYRQLGVPHPVYLAIEQAGSGLKWLQPIVAIGAMAGLASVVLVLLLGQSRIFFAMSRDGLVPPVFARVHPRFRTPFAGTLIVGAVAAVIAAIFPLALLGELVSIGTLFVFFVVCGGVLILRRREPLRPRPFRVPAVWFFAPAGMASCLWLMVSLPGATWVRFLVWLLLGAAIYACYGIRHSRLQQVEHEAQRRPD